MSHLEKTLRPVVAGLAIGLLAAAWAQMPPGPHYVAAPGGYAGPSQLTAGWNAITLTDRFDAPVGIQIFKIKGSPQDHTLIAAIAAVVRGEASAQEADNDAALLAMTEPAGGPVAVPGHPGTAWVDLEPGNYVFASTDVGPDKQPLVTEGLYTHVTVTAGSNQTAPPTAAYQVKLVDFDIELPSRIQAGPHVWYIHNQGAEVHHMMVFQIAQGKTAKDVKAWLEGPPGGQPESGPPPGQFVAATSVLSPGNAEYAPLQLQAGNYVAMCFMTDPLTGKVHAMLGMFVPFTVEAAAN